MEETRIIVKPPLLEKVAGHLLGRPTGAMLKRGATALFVEKAFNLGAGSLAGPVMVSDLLRANDSLTIDQD